MGQGYNDLECNCTPNPSYMTPPPSITILPLYCRVDMAAWGWRGWRIYPPTHQAHYLDKWWLTTQIRLTIICTS